MTHEPPISVSGQPPHGGEKLGAAYVARLREQFPAAILDEEWQTPDQLTITIKLNSLPDVVEHLYYQQGGWLSVLFGNDERSLNGYFAIYYVLSMEGREQYGVDTGKEYGDKCWVIVKALISPERPEFPSVTPRVPAAVWGEREVRDMYGLQPIGLPDERRLVLPDDWPDDLYPLRKDTMDYASAQPLPATLKPISLKMKRAAAAGSCPSARCILPPMSRATFGCLLTAKTLLTPTIAFFMCIEAWKNWLKPAWAITT